VCGLRGRSGGAQRGRRSGYAAGEVVPIAALGSANERVGGLEAGAVQAAMLTEPFAAAARKAGYQVLFDFGEEDYELPSSSVTTTRGYLESDPQTVRAFVAALVDAIHYIKTDREGTMAIMGDFLQQDDREVLEAIYREASGNAMPEAPYPSVRAFANGLEQIASQNPTVRQVRAEDLVEDRIVRELDQSGYIRALYGR
jgi:ABC-type nitrate/sulfonate/bicarbonate transport system substrate-binding protein